MARGLGRQNCPKNKIKQDRRGQWVLKVGGRKRKCGGPIKASGLTCVTRHDCSGHTLCLTSALRFARLTRNLSFSLIPHLSFLSPHQWRHPLVACGFVLNVAKCASPGVDSQSTPLLTNIILLLEIFVIILIVSTTLHSMVPPTPS